MPDLRRSLLVCCLALAASCGSARSEPASASATSSGGGESAASASPSSARPGESAIGDVAADFPSHDPNRWVNGAPFSLHDARGDVVLVESWHRL